MMEKKPNTLHDIATACKVDKHKKRYLNFYEQVFSPMRFDAIKLFEIGVFKGASMRMWVDYFPNAEVVGMDIEPFTSEHPRVTVLQGDQADKTRLEKIGREYGPFDVVVDDGGHTMHQQQTSLGVLFKFVKPGGLYIIEDLHTRDTFWGKHYNETGQITTWQMAADYEKTGVLSSPSVFERDQLFLMNHIQKCERFSHRGCRLCCFRKKG